jgi:hypothetical protein
MSSTEVERFAALLQAACGITRTRVIDLDREAGERAAEARAQVGLDGEALIGHPSGDAIRIRLDWPSSIGAGELATWNYLWRDPVQAAVNGLMASKAHRDVLVNPGFTHWGLGIYTELPTPVPSWTTEALWRRWYFIIWVSTGTPQTVPAPLPLMRAGEVPTFSGSIGHAWVMVNQGTNVRLGPRLAADRVDFNTSQGPLKAAWLGPVKGDTWLAYGDRWSCLWIPDRGGFRYVHSSLHDQPRPIV